MVGTTHERVVEERAQLAVKRGAASSCGNSVEQWAGVDALRTAADQKPHRLNQRTERGDGGFGRGGGGVVVEIASGDGGDAFESGGQSGEGLQGDVDGMLAAAGGHRGSGGANRIFTIMFAGDAQRADSRVVEKRHSPRSGDARPGFVEAVAK